MSDEDIKPDELPVAIGSDAFIKRLAGETAQPEQTPEEAQKLSVSINPRGELIGDTSHLPENILAQLQTPEAQAMMAKQYKESRYGDQKPKSQAARMLHDREDRRVFIERKPPHIDSKTWRKMCRKSIRNTTKAAKKVLRDIDRKERAKRSEPNGGQSDQPPAS